MDDEIEIHLDRGLSMWCWFNDEKGLAREQNRLEPACLKYAKKGQKFMAKTFFLFLEMTEFAYSDQNMKKRSHEKRILLTSFPVYKEKSLFTVEKVAFSSLVLSHPSLDYCCIPPIKPCLDARALLFSPTRQKNSGHSK